MTHRAQITASINKYLDKARELYPNANIPAPAISFKMKGGTRLGIARYGARTFEIRINDLVAKKYLNDAINDTAPHEVAHLVAYKVYGRCQGHGPNWKRIMRQFGITPSRLADSSIDTLEFKIFKAKTEHTYTCSKDSCVHNVGTGIHRKIMMGATYTCKTTGGKLTNATFIKTERKTALQRKTEAYAKAGRPMPGAPTSMAARTVSAPASHNVPTGGSKKVRAEAIYSRSRTDSRTAIIQRFITSLDMTAAGAATYYANCKKKFG